MNIRVGRIARRQAIIGGFAPEASPPCPLMASEVKDDDDEDASSSGINEMST